MTHDIITCMSSILWCFPHTWWAELLTTHRSRLAIVVGTRYERVVREDNPPKQRNYKVHTVLMNYRSSGSVSRYWRDVRGGTSTLNPRSRFGNKLLRISKRDCNPKILTNIRGGGGFSTLAVPLQAQPPLGSYAHVAVEYGMWCNLVWAGSWRRNHHNRLLTGTKHGRNPRYRAGRWRRKPTQKHVQV